MFDHNGAYIRIYAWARRSTAPGSWSLLQAAPNPSREDCGRRIQALSTGEGSKDEAYNQPIQKISCQLHSEKTCTPAALPLPPTFLPSSVRPLGTLVMYDRV